MTVCDVSNIEQTLFLGCSVINFSCSLGFNEQPTEVTVRLVEDEKEASPGRPKIYYDITQQSNIRQEWTGADPGFLCYGTARNEPPRLGAPCYFRMGDFEFSGILQSWTKQDVASDTNVYEVKLVTPTEVLRGCQVILGDYTGPIKGFNIFNVYGFHELFSANSPAPVYIDSNHSIDGPLMGSLAGGFGGSLSNKVGMPWRKVREGINILTSTLIPYLLPGPGTYSQVGRIAFYGAQANARFGLIPHDDVNISLGLAFGISNHLSYYVLDITELPNIPDDYRIAGPSTDILSLISQVCSDFGHDFYIEFLPTKLGTTLYKVIKIRTISRQVQPDLDIVQQFIEATPEVINSSFGRELRNENTTTFLVGGQKQSIIQIYSGPPDPDDDPEEDWIDDNFGNETSVRDRIAPYFGKDQYGNVYVLNTDGISNPNNHYINLNLTSRANWKILNEIIPDQLQVTIGEMRKAEITYDGWASYTVSADTHLNQILTSGGLKIDSILNPVFDTRQLTSRDMVKLNTREIEDQLLHELRQYREIIADIYQQSKSTLMVRVPWVKARYSFDETVMTDPYYAVIYTDEPIDGGWSESDNILNLTNPSAYVDRLRAESGEIKPFAMFDLPTTGVNGVSQTASSTSAFETTDSFAIDRTLIDELDGEGQILYHSFSEEQEFVFLDRLNLISPRVVIKFNNPLDFQSDTNPFFNKEGWQFDLAENAQDAFNNSNNISIEPELTANLISPPIRIPDAVAIALKSNVHTYGPWKPDNIIEAGPPGQIRFQKEPDLVPWTYGSLSNLRDIAQLRANSYVSAMNEGEVGQISIFGLPTVPLGSEIASLNGLTSQFYDSDQHLIENRTITVSSDVLDRINGEAQTFTTLRIPFGSWNGAFGPPLTNINVEFNPPNSLQTTYSFRTYTPKFGFMTKLNADRLQQRYVLDNQRRAQQRFFDESRRVRQNYNAQLNKISNKVNRSLQGDVRAQQGTPHSVLVGNIVPWDRVPLTGTLALTGTGDDEYRRSIVASKDLFEVQNHLIKSNSSGTSSYDSMAIMSMDGLVRPVSVTGGGGLPRYYRNHIPATTHFEHRNATASPFSRIEDYNIEDGYYYGNIGNSFANSPVFPCTGAVFDNNINQLGPAIYTYNRDINYFNPFVNASGSLSLGSGVYTGTAGHDIDIVARGTFRDFGRGSGYTGTHNSLILPIDTGNDLTDIRFLALRGPLVLHGWGYDTNGKPVPNAVDTEQGAASGLFRSDELHDRFLDNFLNKSHTWPVAPVDLRLDRRRGVWTAPPPYPILTTTLYLPDHTGCEFLDQNISGIIRNETIPAFMQGMDDVYDATGNFYSQHMIPIRNPTYWNSSASDRKYFLGDEVSVQYDSNDGYYHIIDNDPSLSYYMALGYMNEAGNGQIDADMAFADVKEATIIHPDNVVTASTTIVRPVLLADVVTNQAVLLYSNRMLKDGVTYQHAQSGTVLYAMPLSSGSVVGTGTGECDCGDFFGDMPDGNVTVTNGVATTTPKPYTIIRGVVAEDTDGAVTFSSLQYFAGSKQGLTTPLENITNTYSKRYKASERLYAAYNDTTSLWDIVDINDIGYMMIKGKTVEAVSQEDDRFTITDVKKLGELTELPLGDIVVANIDFKAYGENETIIAVYDTDLDDDMLWRDNTNNANVVLVVITTEIEAATKTMNDFLFTPSSIDNVSTMKRFANGKYGLSMRSITLKNRSPDSVEAPSDGRVHIGEAELIDGDWFLRTVYCTDVEAP